MKHADVRRLALALPGASEEPHHGFPSFRVKRRIFATLPDSEHANVMLEPADIEAAVRSHPDCCEVQLWGSRPTAVRVDLTAVPGDVLRDLLHEAWERRA